MRRLLIPLSLLLLALAVPSAGFSQAADSSLPVADSSELFLNAYTANQQGEELENQGNPKGALSKYRYAASLLEQIGTQDPKWQPLIVEYRKKRISQNIERIQKQYGAEPPAGAEGPGTGAPQAMPPTDTAAASSSPPPIDGDLPSKDGGLGAPPEITDTSSPRRRSETVAESGDSGPGQVMREQLEQMQSDLQKSQSRLRQIQREKEKMATQLDETLKQLDQTKVSEAELKSRLKQTQDSYQNALADQGNGKAGDKEAEARITQLQNALRDAEADRDAADEQSEALARRVVKARQNTQAEAKDRDAATAQVKELQAKTATVDKIAAQLKDARQQITTLTAARDTATEHAAEADKKLAKAAKTAAQLAAAQEQIASLTKDRDAATEHATELEQKFAKASKTAAALVDAQKQIATLKQDKETAAQQNAALATQLADARKEVAQLGQDRDAARGQVTALNGKLADAQKQIATVTADRDSIAAQRDQALADLDKAREAQKKVDQLLADNASLTQKLAADEATIRNFKSNSPEKDQQIAALRKEVTDAKAALTTSQKERDDIQGTLNTLQQQFDATSTELADLKTSGINSDEKKKLTSENDLLRGIVLRQLKEQARRDQAKKLAMAELGKLQIQSDTLLKQIDYLGQPVTKLTEQEKALFKDPQIEIADADSSDMAISIAAPRRTGAAPATSPSPDSVLSLTPSDAGQGTAPSSPTAPPAGSSAAASASATPFDLANLTKQPAGTAAGEEPTGGNPGAGSPGAGASTQSAAAGNASVNPAPTVPKELMDDARTAKEHFERTEYREAEKVYERMLTKAPNNVYILSNLGVVYYRNGKWKLAEESLKKAVAVAPEDTFSYCTLGIVFYQQHKFDDAINALTRALAINPRYAVAHNYLGITASQKGWQEAAKKELETATNLDPGYGDAYFNLAVIYAMQQPPDKEMARKYYKRAIDLGAEPDAAMEELIKEAPKQTAIPAINTTASGAR